MATAISTPIAIALERNAETVRLLKEFYPSCAEGIPQQRQKAHWQAENKLGFFMGLINYGIDTHVEDLLQILQTGGFQEQQLFSKPIDEPTFIDRMFDWYIMPFHKSYNENSCHTPSKVSSRSNSRPSSAKQEEDQDYQTKQLKHRDLKDAVEKRDGVCLFCWDKLECEGAHIIAQKNIPMTYDESSLLQRAGLTQKHQIQNGLLLCNKCHSQFDKLKRYVDFDDDKLVVRVVNETNDETSDKHREWIRTVRDLKIARTGREEDWINSDNRQAVKTNGDMALYFVQNNPTNFPNRNALEFHKAACMIWRMGGGAETDEEYCSDDEDLGSVDTAALKRRFKIQDSAETLNIVS